MPLIASGEIVIEKKEAESRGVDLWDGDREARSTASG